MKVCSYVEFIYIDSLVQVDVQGFVRVIGVFVIIITG